MPSKVIVYDRGCAEIKDADGKITQAKQDAREIKMWSVTAREACANDQTRYSLSKPKNFGAPPVAQPKPAVKPAAAPAAKAPANDATKTT